MNIVIAGDGEVGFHLAKLLSGEKHNITVVDPHKELLKLLEAHSDILTITGDATSIEVLKEANIKNADLLISVVHDERINLVTCLLGKKLGAKRAIARIDNPEYLSEENIKIFSDLGIDSMVCPERIASEEIVRLLKQTAATEIFDFSDGKLSLFLIKLDEKAPVINRTLNDIAHSNPLLDFRTIAIHRNSKTIIPRGNDKFQPSDLAYVVTKQNAIDDLLKLGGKESYPIHNVMIIGGGRVGRKTAKRIENKFNIKLFEINKEKSEYLAEYLNNVLVINGDARDIDLLEDEGIRGVDAFIATTDNSETNILTCLHAKKLGVKKTIALVENIDYIDISQNIGIDTIINKKLITASYMVRFTMHAVVTSIKCLNGIDADVLELIAQPGSLVTKKPIKNLNFPKGAIIGGIVRGDESHIAVGDFQIQQFDRVVVFTLPQSVHKVDEFFN